MSWGNTGKDGFVNNAQPSFLTLSLKHDFQCLRKNPYPISPWERRTSPLSEVLWRCQRAGLKCQPPSRRFGVRLVAREWSGCLPWNASCDDGIQDSSTTSRPTDCRSRLSRAVLGARQLPTMPELFRHWNSSATRQFSKSIADRRCLPLTMRL